MKRPGGPLVIAAIYLLFGFLWILISDHLLFLIAPDLESYSALQTSKGWIYVGITTALIYLLLKAYSGHKNRALQELAEKNEEKKALIRELHHRVKNNLQLIISIINLSGSGMEAITGRIYTVSTIQEAIFSGDIYARVTLDRYLRDIAGYIRGQLHRPLGADLLIDLPGQLSLPSDAAVPLGILYYELLGNAMRHGDIGKTVDADTGDVQEEKAAIRVFMEKRGSSYLLQISDPGRGFTPSPEMEKTGLLLARIMTREIGGEITFSSSGTGTRVEVTFPVSEPRDPAESGQAPLSPHV